MTVTLHFVILYMYLFSCISACKATNKDRWNLALVLRFLYYASDTSALYYLAEAMHDLAQS